MQNSDITIEELKQRVSIFELAEIYNAEPKAQLGEGVHCRVNPLRDERSSSLKLYSSTNSYCDFGDTGGSIIDFVMKAEGITIKEAIDKLKSMSGFVPVERHYEPSKTFMSPQIVTKIWEQQIEVDMKLHKSEMKNIAPLWLFDEANEMDKSDFFRIVRIEKQNKCAFVLLEDDGIPRTIRYRRYHSQNVEDNTNKEIKWMALPSSQSAFPYKRIKDNDDYILIVEGTHDYIAAILAGYNVIAIPSAKYKLNYDLLKNKIAVFIDDDDGKDSMRELFDNAPCSKIWFDHAKFKSDNKIKEGKDFSDYLEKFKNLEDFKKAIELQCDLITHSEFTTTNNRLKKFSDLTDDIKAPSWMIKGILPEDGLLEIVGASRSYKTFILLDMMFCISEGLEYHSRSVNSGVCVYVAGEGKTGAVQRVRALEKRYGVRADNFYILPMPSNLMDAKEMDMLASDIKAVSSEGVAMVMFDTLHRNSAGSKENSQDDFAVMLGHIDKFLKPISKIVGYVHHTGKDGKSRGTTARYAAADTAIFVGSDDKYTCVLENTKQKDSEEFEPIGFKLHHIDIGLFNEDGEEIMSLYPEFSADVIPLKKEGDENEKYTKKKKIDDSEIANMIFDYISANDGCKMDDIKDAMKPYCGRQKVFDIASTHKDIRWRAVNISKNSWAYHIIKPNPTPEVIEYKMDIATELF